MDAGTGQLDELLIDAEGQYVTGDAPCRTCEYNLRTLAVGGVCPECGSPVVDSLQRDRLMFADLRWLRRLRRGTRLLFVAAIGFMLGFVFLLLTNLVFMWSAAYAWIEFYYLLVGFCWLGGVVWGMMREPASRFSALQCATRWLARLSALVLLAVWSLVILVSVFHSPLSLPNWSVMVLQIVLFFLPFVTPLMVCLHFLPVAARERRKRLRRLNLVIASLMGFNVLFFLAAIILALTGVMSIDPGAVFLVVLGVPLVAFILGIFGFVGHLRMLTRAIAGHAGSERLFRSDDTPR